MWSQKRFSVSPPKFHKDLSSSGTISFDSLVLQYDSTDEQETSDTDERAMPLCTGTKKTWATAETQTTTTETQTTTTQKVG